MEKKIVGLMIAVLLFFEGVSFAQLQMQRQEVAPRPIKTTPQNIITVAPGKSVDFLVPGRLPKTQARLVTIPKTRTEQVMIVPNVTVVPGDENAGKTARYYRISTTPKTPQGAYQMQYYDSLRKSWYAIPTNVVQVNVAAPSGMADRQQAAAQAPSGAQLGAAATAQLQTPELLSPLTFINCQFENTGQSYVGKVYMKNSGDKSISFNTGQKMARSIAPRGTYDHTAPGGGQYLPAGGTIPLSWNLGTLSPGQYTITWEADPDHLFTSTYMKYRTRTCELTVTEQIVPEGPKPDLIVANIDISPSPGTPSTAIRFTITVTNIGQVPTTGHVGQIPNCFIDGRPFDGPYENWPNSPIQPGQSASYVRTRSAGLIPGVKTIECTTDKWGDIAETNETNNSLSKQFTIQE
jgi:hypothetical protein